MLVVLERPEELFLHHFWIVTSWSIDEICAQDLLEHYRQRGTAEGYMGELMDALAPALSSAPRAKQHYRGRPIEPHHSTCDAYGNNEARLVLNALAYAKDRVQGADLTRMMDKTAPRVTITHHPDVRRSLLTQKAYAEGMRAVYLYTASFQDAEVVAAVHDIDPDLALRVNDLLLPIITVPSSVWRSVTTGWCRNGRRRSVTTIWPRSGRIGASSPTIGASCMLALPAASATIIGTRLDLAAGEVLFDVRELGRDRRTCHIATWDDAFKPAPDVGVVDVVIEDLHQIVIVVARVDRRARCRVRSVAASAPDDRRWSARSRRSCPRAGSSRSRRGSR
mgnify:CR=1 FL=1